MQRFFASIAGRWAHRGLLLGALLTLAGPLQAASDGQAAERAQQREEALRTGQFCAPERCRPVDGSLWTTAAFGLAVLVIHRSARRETR